MTQQLRYGTNSWRAPRQGRARGTRGGEGHKKPPPIYRSPCVLQRTAPRPGNTFSHQGFRGKEQEKRIGVAYGVLVLLGGGIRGQAPTGWAIVPAADADSGDDVARAKLLEAPRSARRSCHRRGCPQPTDRRARCRDAATRQAPPIAPRRGLPCRPSVPLHTKAPQPERAPRRSEARGGRSGGWGRRGSAGPGAAGTSQQGRHAAPRPSRETRGGYSTHVLLFPWPAVARGQPPARRRARARARQTLQDEATSASSAAAASPCRPVT